MNLYDALFSHMLVHAFWLRLEKWRLKLRYCVSVLYTGHVKEPEGSFEKSRRQRRVPLYPHSLSLGRPISPKLAETDAKTNKQKQNTPT